MSAGGAKGGKWAILLPYIWLLALFLVPFLLVAKVSLSGSAIAIPPYAPAFSLTDGWQTFLDKLDALSLENYLFIFEDSLYWKSFLSSFRIAVTATFLTALIGYPLALAMARAPRHWRPILLAMIILPFWTSFLIRVYAWIGILKKEGLLNQLLLWLGVIGEPLTILNTNTAVYIGIIYSYLPFLVLPLYASLEKQDLSLLEAATDLGCSPLQAFWRITFPLSLGGLFAGCLLVFIPAMGEFVIPELLGGSETLMIGKTLWNEFFQNRDWPVAAAVAIVLLVMLVVPIVLFQRNQIDNREQV